MITEQPNPNTLNIDKLDTLGIVTRINAEDQMVALAVQRVLPQIAAAVDAIVERLQRGGRMIYIGAGTSGRLGILDAVECVPTFGTPPELVQGIIAGGDTAIKLAVEGAEDRPELGVSDLQARNLTEADVVVGIAASGRTPYVLGAVEYARQLGAVTVGVACNEPSAVLDAVDYPIGVVVGPEVIAGSTRMKSGTAQKLVLNTLSTATMIRMGKVYGNRMVDVQVTNEKLAIRAIGLVKHFTGLDDSGAADLLKQSGQSVKLAIVMQRRGVGVDEARDLLAQVGGRLQLIDAD